MTSTRMTLLATAGVVLIVLGAVFGGYGWMQGKSVTVTVRELYKGVPIGPSRITTAWAPGAVFWVGLVAVAAGLIAIAFVLSTRKVAPEAEAEAEARRVVLEPIPA